MEGRNTILKRLLIGHFKDIQDNWDFSVPQEHSPDVKQRMYWLRIKHILQEITFQLRLLQTREERQLIHVTNQYDSVETVYEKLIDLWTNYIKIETLNISNDDNQWKKICVHIFDVLSVFRHQRQNECFRGD